MPVPPQPKPWSTTMILIGILSAIIIAFIAFCIYLRSRPSNNSADPEASRLSQVAGESEPSISPAEANCDSTRIRFKMMGRLPRPESDTISAPVRSVHASVHNASPASSTFQTPPPAFGRRQSDPEHRGDPQVAKEGSRTRFSKRKDRHRRKKFGGQSLDSKIDQRPSLEPPALIELPRASLESNEQTDKSHQVYSPFNGPGTSTGSLLEMFPVEYETAPPGAGSAGTGFDPPATNAPGALRSNDRFPDLRVTASSIVETTEKHPPARILRKKLLSLISTQPRPGTGNESEEKYYWEMMQVETNDTWWLLPFPPQLSPIKSEFELPGPDFGDRSQSQQPMGHAATTAEAHSQRIGVGSRQTP